MEWEKVGGFSGERVGGRVRGVRAAKSYVSGDYYTQSGSVPVAGVVDVQ